MMQIIEKANIEFNAISFFEKLKRLTKEDKENRNFLTKIFDFFTNTHPYLQNRIDRII